MPPPFPPPPRSACRAVSWTYESSEAVGRGTSSSSPSGSFPQHSIAMPYVITDPCIDVRDQACVTVCPVACIHCDAGKDRKLYIDPDECIDCGACVPVCPVKAIYTDYELPTPWRAYADIDALWYRDKEAARARAAAMKDGS